MPPQMEGSLPQETHASCNHKGFLRTGNLNSPRTQGPREGVGVRGPELCFPGKGMDLLQEALLASLR